MPAASQSQLQIISSSTSTASLIPTGEIWNCCRHSRGSFGHFSTSILAVKLTLEPTFSPEHLLVCRSGPPGSVQLEK